MLKLLRSLEWCAPFVALPHTNCPACGKRRENGHAPDCRLDRAIRELAEGRPYRSFTDTSAGWVEGPDTREYDLGSGTLVEPTVDEMAREMGYQRCQDCGRWRGPDITRDCYPDDRIPTLYREHKAKQLADTLAGKRVGPWLTPPAPKVYEASGIVDQPPTDPVALAAWLYARVVPGQTIVEYGRAYKVPVETVTLRAADVLVETRHATLAIPGGDVKHVCLLNPDGTVLWPAPRVRVGKNRAYRGKL